MTAGRGHRDPPGVADLAQAVQVLGLASAAAVADRYVGAVEDFLARRGAGSGATAWPWAGPTGRGGAAEARAGGTDGTEAQGTGLRLPAAAPGGVSTGSVWVHNGTDLPVVVEVRAGPLASASGHALPPDALRLGVTAPSPLPPGASAEVRLVVRVPPGTPPGHVHTLVTCTATPEQALPVSLLVLGTGASS